MRVLAVGAHPDDVVLGCGGLLQNSHEDHVFLVSIGAGRDARQREGLEKEARLLGIRDSVCLADELGLRDQRFDEEPLLDIIQELERLCGRFRPERVLTHAPKDLNLDHEITTRAVLTACRAYGQFPVDSILGYESEGTQDFHPNLFVELTTAQLQRKLEIFTEAYPQEGKPFAHPRSVMVSRAGVRGSVAGFTYAEAFKLLFGRVSSKDLSEGRA